MKCDGRMARFPQRRKEKKRNHWRKSEWVGNHGCKTPPISRVRQRNDDDDNDDDGDDTPVTFEPAVRKTEDGNGRHYASIPDNSISGRQGQLIFFLLCSHTHSFIRVLIHPHVVFSVFFFA